MDLVSCMSKRPLYYLVLCNWCPSSYFDSASYTSIQNVVWIHFSGFSEILTLVFVSASDSTTYKYKLWKHTFLHLVPFFVVFWVVVGESKTTYVVVYQFCINCIVWGVQIVLHDAVMQAVVCLLSEIEQSTINVLICFEERKKCFGEWVGGILLFHMSRRGTPPSHPSEKNAEEELKKELTIFILIFRSRRRRRREMSFWLRFFSKFCHHFFCFWHLRVRGCVCVWRGQPLKPARILNLKNWINSGG